MPLPPIGIGTSRLLVGYNVRGLPHMKELVEIAGVGSLAIWSRGGVCRLRPGKAPSLQNYGHSVGGTLIEWILEFPG